MQSLSSITLEACFNSVGAKHTALLDALFCREWFGEAASLSDISKLYRVELDDYGNIKKIDEKKKLVV